MAQNIEENVQLTLDPISLILCQFSDPLNSNHTFQFITDSYFMERGIKYNTYAQLRESKLLSKQLQLHEIQLISEIPTSSNSPSVKKSVSFHEQASAVPKLDGSKKAVKFHGNSGEVSVNVSVSAIPRPDFCRKSVKFHEISSKCEVPTSEEYSSPVKFEGIKQGSSTLRKENRKPTPENTVADRIHRSERCTTPPAPSMAKREKLYDTSTKSGGRSKSVNAAEKQRMMFGRKSYASIQELKGLSIAASNAINGETRGAKKSHLLRKSTVFGTTKFY